MKRHGAIWNKLVSFHSNMSNFRHKYTDSRGEMMVSSGIKTRAFMAAQKTVINKAVLAVWFT